MLSILTFCLRSEIPYLFSPKKKCRPLYKRTQLKKICILVKILDVIFSMLIDINNNSFSRKHWKKSNPIFLVVVVFPFWQKLFDEKDKLYHAH